MGQGRSILKNSAIYALGNFCSKILAFALLPLYTFYLTKEEFGTYDLFIVSINLLAPIISIQISEAVYRWLIEEKQDKKKQDAIIFNGLLIVTTVFVFFYFIFLFVTSYVVELNYSGYFSILLLVNLYVPFFQKVLRGLDKNLIFAISGVLNTLFLLILNLLFLSQFNLKIESLFLASIISNIIVLGYIFSKIDLKSLIDFKHFNKTEINEMIRYSLPLVPNSVSWWLINASDKYFILLLINVEANGVFAISTRFAAIIMIANSIFLMAWQDHGLGVKNSEKNTLFFSKLFNTFITFEMTSVIFLISIAPYLIEYLIDPLFIDAWKYLPLLFIGIAFSAFSAYLNVGYKKMKKTKSILTTTLAGGLVNLVISISLIKEIGLYAPALGTFISFLVVYLLRKKQTNSFFKIEVNNQKFIFFVVTALVFAFLINIDNLYLRCSLIITSLTVFFISNKTLINQIWRIFTQKFLKSN